MAVLHVAYKDGVCGEKWGEIIKLPKDVMDQRPVKKHINEKLGNFKNHIEKL